jgi:hypothetical protein
MFSWLHNFLPSPIFFHLGIINIYWYGLIIVLGIILSLTLILSLAKKFKIDTEKIWDLSFYLVLFGIIGARIYEIFLELPSIKNEVAMDSNQGYFANFIHKTEQRSETVQKEEAKGYQTSTDATMKTNPNEINLIEKIDKLLDYEYLKKEVLIPTLEFSLENKYINKLEFQILKRTVEKAIIQAGDLDDIIKSKNASEKSRQIKNLIEKKMLMPEKEGARKYSLRFDNNYLFRGIMQILNEKGFLPIKD